MLGINIDLRRFPSRRFDSPLSPSLSNDTSLSTFTVDGSPVSDNDVVNLANGTLSVTVIATPTHPSATVGTITGDTGLSTGDNVLSFDVTAEDEVTVETYNLTLHVLNTGTAEETEIDFGSITGTSFVTAGEGIGIIISNATQRIGFWGDSGTETQPDWSAFGVTHYVPISVNPFNTSAAISSDFEATFQINDFATARTDNNTFHATVNAGGAREDAVSNAGTVTVITQGVDPS